MKLLVLLSLALLAGLIFTIRIAINAAPPPPDPKPERDTPAKTVQTRHPAPQSIPEPPLTLSGSAYVVDGDTIRLTGKQIRLFGIDAPELNHPFGQKAKWALVALCKGQTVSAEVVDEDAHGRVVAKCSLADGRDLSAEMVRQGMALDWPKFSGGFYRDLETDDARKKLWLAAARQKGHMHLWEAYETRKAKADQKPPSS